MDGPSENISHYVCCGRDQQAGKKSGDHIMSACPGKVLTCRELNGLLFFSQQEKLLFSMCKSL